MPDDWSREEVVENVHVNHNLSGFNGDPRFVQNDHPQKLFSKLRSSIGGAPMPIVLPKESG